ncbi:MAG: 2-C-methyl-D-erythritol 4-phosphate cytidylyltransferase [Vicinamibacterales bacterium]
MAAREGCGSLMHVAAIIAAGGRGERLGGRVAKPLRIIGDRTMLERSIAPFDTSDRIDEIVVVLPPDVLSTPPPALAAFSTPLRLVSGGGRRQDSVAAGFDAVTSTADIVVVHDAARPFCSVELIAATVDAAFESGAAIAALPTRDTVKEGRIEEGIGFRFVSATLERDRIFLAQTPQAFRVDVLREAVALGRGGLEATDEAVLAERAGHRIRLIEGEPRNIKVTTDADLSFARDMAAAATTRQHARVGLGFDLHRLVDGRRLVLGGVHIPGDRGLQGHSDADAVCHAVTDAVLGAASAGDIGTHFPDDDDRWRDASSVDLLRQATTIVHDRGFEVSNVDVVVVAEWPTIRGYVDQMKQQLADALRVNPDQISVKGKTNEGVGAIGRGEAIAVHAIASLRYDDRLASTGR